MTNTKTPVRKRTPVKKRAVRKRTPKPRVVKTRYLELGSKLVAAHSTPDRLSKAIIRACETHDRPSASRYEKTASIVLANHTLVNMLWLVLDKEDYVTDSLYLEQYDNFDKWLEAVDKHVLSKI